MNRHRTNTSGQEGFAFMYMAVGLSLLLVATGLALDSGRAYVVKAQLSKAVDGAALGAARNLNSGVPRTEAVNIFKANFPAGYFGTSSSTDPTTDPGFFSSRVDAVTGVNIVTVTAVAVLPTTFMRLANINEVNVAATGEATRRMVDLSLVLDVSGSIGSDWPIVRDAAREFINSFDAAHDRLALLTFSDAAKVLDAMPSSRGFNKAGLVSHVPSSLPGGSTNMVEGIYQGWDELRTVPLGSQSGLRIIVLFTDGTPNGVPGNWDPQLGTATSLRTTDFPSRGGITTDTPTMSGLYDSLTGVQSTPSQSRKFAWNSPLTLATMTPSPAPATWGFIPVTSWHTHHRSAGIPTQFPLQSGAITVDRVAQSSARGLRNFNAGNGRFPAEVVNVNNAARNLVEIVANEARNDVGDYRVRIYSIGMGSQLQMLLGARNEMSEDMLKRVSNDKLSLDFNSAQLEGRYFYAPNASDVGPAFQGIQNQILRLSK